MQSTFFEVLQVTATSRDILEAACGYSRGSPVGAAPPGRQSQAVRGRNAAPTGTQPASGARLTVKGNKEKPPDEI
jgi:hypothetical protein